MDGASKKPKVIGTKPNGDFQNAFVPELVPILEADKDRTPVQGQDTPASGEVDMTSRANEGTNIVLFLITHLIETRRGRFEDA